MICASLLLILLIIFDAASGANFWLTTELLHLEWKKECSATKYCTRPQLRLTQQNLVNSESLSINWLFSDDVVTVTIFHNSFNFQDYARPFVTYWIRGTPNDIGITTEIIGFDPKYGFQRICDFTASKRIFLPIDDENPETMLDLIDAKSHNANNRRMIVELKGKCFEASLAVQKHLEVCPWCATASTPPSTAAFVTATAAPLLHTTPPPAEFLKDHVVESSVFNYFTDTQTILILLASVATAFFACVGFICLLLAFYRLRSQPRQQKKKKVFTLLPTNALSKPLNSTFVINNTSSKHDEKLQHPILRWDSNSTTQTLATSENASVNSGKTSKNKGYTTVRQISENTVYENMGSSESLQCQNFHIVPASV
uniref:DOMON domain-containing protein n=1 Tax=Syphacia muris TaxID=451379 RepID=A0A0N5ALT7_9BILA